MNADIIRQRNSKNEKQTRPIPVIQVEQTSNNNQQWLVMKHYQTKTCGATERAKRDVVTALKEIEDVDVVTRALYSLDDDTRLKLRFTRCIYHRFFVLVSYRTSIRKAEMRERLWTQATPSLAPLFPVTS